MSDWMSDPHTSSDQKLDHFQSLAPENTQGPATQVTAKRKPCQVVGTATATVYATGASYDQIIDAGLEALGETRSSLFGYGIRGTRRAEAPDRMSGEFTVYADRD